MFKPWNESNDGERESRWESKRKNTMHKRMRQQQQQQLIDKVRSPSICWDTPDLPHMTVRCAKKASRIVSFNWVNSRGNRLTASCDRGASPTYSAANFSFNVKTWMQQCCDYVVATPLILTQFLNPIISSRVQKVTPHHDICISLQYQTDFKRCFSLNC